MATSASGEPISEADVTGFAEKLNTWAHDLTPAEQTLLHRLLTRAASTEADDAEGYIIVIGGGFPVGDLTLEAGQPSPLLRRAVGLSEFTIVKKIDKSSP